ncbi:pseudouridine synthase pus4 [Coemansia sp. RSA 720]|nr:pseudouridine synthase pus4 [Coemansia sp. RSA 720]KAJ2544989.1 pseudouridine synthase pus4 [Coemansia sp. RSA 1853]
MLRAAAAEVATRHAARLATSSLHGVFAVNKPPGISSAGLLDYLKRNIGLDSACFPFSEHFAREQNLRIPGTRLRRQRSMSQLRVGHGGTLDVEASGVLLVGINNGCQRLDSFLKGGKTYLANNCLGVETDSRDAEGHILKLSDTHDVTHKMINDALPQFVGRIQQKPPVFSAIKMGGKRLYEYARQGLDAPEEIKARTVLVDQITVTHFENPGRETSGRRVALPSEVSKYFAQGRYVWDGVRDMRVGEEMMGSANDPRLAKFQMFVRSGGGVYVRSLVHDLGMAVGCGATMLSLVRVSQGPLRLGRDTIDAEDLPYTDRVIRAMQHAESVIGRDEGLDQG